MSAAKEVGHDTVKAVDATVSGTKTTAKATADTTESAVGKTGSVAREIGHETARMADATVSGTKKAAQKTGETIEKGTKDAKEAIKR